MSDLQYRVIRYAPDMARGERLNIGVCLFDGERYHFRFAEPRTRIRYLDPQFDESLLEDLRTDLEAHRDDSAYLEERITAFDPTFAFSDARVVLNGQRAHEIMDDLYHRLVHMPLPRAELTTVQVPRRRAVLARQFLEHLRVPSEKIIHRLNPVRPEHAEILGLRQRITGEVPIVTACVPNGKSVVLLEPLLIAKLAPKQVYDVGRKFLFYEDRIQPLARKTLKRAVAFLRSDTDTASDEPLLRLSKLFSEQCSDVVCDETDAKSVKEFQAWLWKILHEAPLFSR